MVYPSQKLKKLKLKLLVFAIESRLNVALNSYF